MLESLTVLNDATFEVSIDKYDIHGVETALTPTAAWPMGMGCLGIVRSDVRVSLLLS